MNKIILCGRLTRSPELKATNSGTEVCNFSIAVDRRFKDQNGEKQTDFINCTAWKQSGVFVDKYFRKGDGITIDGRLESRKYIDKDGNNRVAWEVICDNVEFPLSKPSGGDANQGGYVEQDFTEIPESDSELPF